MPSQERELLRLQAEICQTLADPTRLELIQLLARGPLAVKDLVLATGQRQAKVSQHLAIMRQRGIVAAQRVGVEVHYSLADARILDACRSTREVLINRLEHDAGLAHAAGH